VIAARSAEPPGPPMYINARARQYHAGGVSASLANRPQSRL
jgi:hypothetical protein